MPKKNKTTVAAVGAVPVVAPVSIPEPVQTPPQIAQDDAVSGVLGEGGETAIPTVETPVSVPVVNGGGFNLSKAIRHALDNFDQFVTRDDILTFIEDRYGKFLNVDFKKDTFASTLSTLRSKVKTEKPNVNKIDITEAFQLCQTLKMTPTALNALLATVSQVGTVDEIRAALAKVIEFQKLMNMPNS